MIGRTKNKESKKVKTTLHVNERKEIMAVKFRKPTYVD
jgi:hypothetical protein